MKIPFRGISLVGANSTPSFGGWKQDVKLLKPFGCIVWDEVPKEDRKTKGLSKHLDHGTRGCFLGYVSSTTFLYWNFARKAIVHSTNLTFHETEFPQRTDFPDEPDEAFICPPIDEAFYSDDDDDDDDDDESDHEEPSQPSHQPSQTRQRSRQEPPFIYDEIVVEKPPPGTAFSIMFGPLADSTPKSFADAMNRPDSKLWWEALCAEIKAVIQNDTWNLVDLPPGKRAIPLKWVFKVKHDAKGNFEKYKARIVVKGYSQVAGLDFNET
jgi:hypothetical protein